MNKIVRPISGYSAIDDSFRINIKIFSFEKFIEFSNNMYYCRNTTQFRFYKSTWNFIKLYHYYKDIK